MNPQQTEKLERENRKLKKENQELRKMCEDLEKRLRVYENPHIPSSKHIIREVKVKSEPKKRGAPEGHRGDTRKTPKPDIVVELKPKSCPKCDSKKFEIVRERKKISEDIKIIKVVTEFHFYDCHCSMDKLHNLYERL